MEYNTGVSSKGIDFAGAAQSYMRSFVETRVKEIEEEKGKIKDSEALALKAVSLSVIPEMAGEIRDRYQEQLDEYKKDITKRMAQGKGVLSFEDRKFVEKGAAEMANAMESDKIELQKFATLQNHVVSNPLLYSPEISHQMGEWYKKVMSGDKNRMPLDVIQANNVKPIDPLLYIDDKYGALFKRVDTEGKATINGRIVTKEMIQNENEVRNILSMAFRNDSTLLYSIAQRDESGNLVRDESGKVVIDEERLTKMTNDLVPIYQQKTSSVDVTPEKTTGSTTGGTALDTEPFTSATGETVEVIRIPFKLEERMVPGKAIDEGTGQEINIDTRVDARLVAVSIEDDKAYYEISGGTKKNAAGELLYTYPLSSGADSGPVSQKSTNVMTRLKSMAADISQEARYQIEGQPTFTENNDGTITVRAKATSRVKAYREQPEYIEFDLKPAIDDKEVRDISVPLSGKPSVKSELVKRNYIYKGEPISKVLERGSAGKGSGKTPVVTTPTPGDPEDMRDYIDPKFHHLLD